ncbi:MAG: hypothetical protein E7420_08715 [Ruminococcaceae bacterium]|nr:hypothetical protein [Oscillospiraceae bacterium]
MDWTKEVSIDEIAAQLKAKILEDQVLDARFAEFEARKKEFERVQVEPLPFTEKELEEKLRIPGPIFGGTPISLDAAVRWKEIAGNQPIFADYPKTAEEAAERLKPEACEGFSLPYGTAPGAGGRGGHCSGEQDRQAQAFRTGALFGEAMLALKERDNRRQQIKELLEKDYTFIDPTNNMAGRIADRIEFFYQKELEAWKDIFKGMLAPFFYRVYVEIVEEDRERERRRAGEKSHAEGT